MDYVIHMLEIEIGRMRAAIREMETSEPTHDYSPWSDIKEYQEKISQLEIAIRIIKDNDPPDRKYIDLWPET